MYKLLEDKIYDYLQEKVLDFKVTKQGRITIFTCPTCFNQTAKFIGNSKSAQCTTCNKSIGTFYDMVRDLEINKDLTDSQIDSMLASKYNIQLPIKQDSGLALDYYARQKFDCVPIVRGGKRPFEQEWTIKNHKDLVEWEGWLENGLNIGVKTGVISGVTVIDVDSKTLPAEIAPYLADYKGFMQATKKGYHYFFKYDASLPKTAITFGEIHVDVENDGGQVVVYPSIVEDVGRTIVSMDDVPVMPAGLKDILLKSGGERKVEIPVSDILLPEFDTDIKLLGEGNRNNFLMHFGGLLRKELNVEQTKHVLEIVNQKFIEPSLPRQEFSTILTSLEKYVKFDEKDFARKILDYIQIVKEAEARDLQEVLREPKEKIEKTLAYLVREGYIIKHRRYYSLIEKVDWKDHFDATDETFTHDVPYFDHIANFCWGDLVLLGSQNKRGKTTIAMNIIKSFVDQGVKPYYLSLEAGSRFKKTWNKMGGAGFEFYNGFQPDPAKVTLEKGAVTILDWLMVEDKAMTDTVFKHFVEQLYRSKGFLFVFMQLKTDNTWFAPNLVNQFPALSARYIYDDVNDGSKGHWKADVIRDPKDNIKITDIPCEYDFGTRIHKRVNIT